MSVERELDEQIKKFELNQLIGVYHGMDGIDFLGGAHPISVGPSLGLQNVLTNLPSDSRVGIEFNPDLSKRYTSKIFSRDVIEFSPSTINYWRKVVELCNKNRLSVVYLDDVSLTLETACHRLEANFVGMEIEQSEETCVLWESGDEYFKDLYDSNDIENIRSSMDINYRKKYAHEVIGDYLLIVKREESIFKKIHQNHLDLAILGKGHADILAFDPAVKEYKSESINGKLINLSDGKPDFEESLDRKLLTRRFNSVMEGRIDPSMGDPDFVGYWEGYSKEYHTSIPDVGLFEMYLDGPVSENGRFRGLTVDVLGDALVDGIIKDNSIEFTKAYIPEVSKSFAKDPIKYKCERAGDKFVGKYTLSNKDESGFVLQKFDREKLLLPKIDTSLNYFKPSDLSV